MPDTNPLLQAWDLPPWSEVRTEHLVPAITAIITDNRQVIAETITSQSVFPNWDDLVLAIDEIDARLGEAMGIIQILSMAKHNDTAWNTAAAVCRDARAQYRSERMSNRPLFDAYQRLANSSNALHVDEPR
jgi:oligopeptidase A